MTERLARFLQDHFIRSHHLNATRLVAASFGVVILLGTILLALPISTRSGESVGLLSALFTATSATCVTGLVVADTALTWSGFGQVVILLMIQLGGLGFMTVITLISLAVHRHIGLSERLVMVSTLNLNDMDGVVRVVRRALMGAALFEGAGTVLLSVRMVPRYGLGRGLWHALFHAVSAFCNAGFDLQGADSGPFSSLTAFRSDPVVLLTTAVLIVVGGLGFFLWDDVLQKRRWRTLTLYTKMVLSLTAVLILGGTVFFLAVEGSNPGTLGEMPLGEKWLNAFFQSVTLRTAGFNAIDQAALTDDSLVMSCIFMLIGGGSGSTAGGVKVATVGVLFLMLSTGLRGREEIVFRGRSLPLRRAVSAVNLFLVVLLLLLAGAMTIALVEDVPFLAAAYETASALGTVGLTLGLTPALSPLSRGLLILLMYAGRVGVLSCSIAFLTRPRDSVKLKYPKFDVMIG